MGIRTKGNRMDCGMADEKHHGSTTEGSRKTKEEAVKRVTCPACDAVFEVDGDEIVLYNRFPCEECGALLEVIEEDPVELEAVGEEAESDEEDDCA
jgi:lysine biosynthesis protein LysW